MKNIHRIGFLLLMTVFCFSSNAFAQAKTEKEIVIVKKSIDADGNETEEKIILTGAEAEKYIKEQEIKITEKTTGNKGEKEMTIEVTAEGGEYEEMTIELTAEGGEDKLKEDEQVIFIEGDGEEIPEEVKKMLQEKGIDIDALIKEGKGEMKLEETQHYKVIEIDDDGNKKVIEWNGEGEMPQEMDEIMQKAGTESKTVKKKVMIIDDEDVEIDIQGEKKIIKIVKDENGVQSEKVYGLSEGEEMPAEVLDLLNEHGIDLDALSEKGKMKIQIELEEEAEGKNHKGGEHHKGHQHHRSHHKDHPANKAQLGVMIEDGTRVASFTENGAAESAGVLIDDVIVKVDKTLVKDMDSLIDALKDKEPGDIVKLKVLREDKVKKIKVTLKASEVKLNELELEKGKTTSEHYRTEHKVLKIEGGDIVKCSPNDSVTKKEALTKEEIEIVEERIIEETGVDQVEVFSGSNTLQVETIDLFPNPTDGSIRVRFHIDNQEETNVQILDIAGRSIYKKNITNFSGVFDEDIDLSAKGMGTMVLVISQGKKAFTEKIMLN